MIVFLQCYECHVFGFATKLLACLFDCSSLQLLAPGSCQPVAAEGLHTAFQQLPGRVESKLTVCACVLCTFGGPLLIPTTLHDLSILEYRKCEGIKYLGSCRYVCINRMSGGSRRDFTNYQGYLWIFAGFGI